MAILADRRGVLSQRSLADNPANTAGLGLWLKADSLALADAAAVSSWTDSSGNSRTASQATGANQPTFRTAVINSLPVVRFDGSNDVLSVTTGLDLLNAKTGWTVFAVAKSLVNATTNKVLFIASSGSAPTANRATLQEGATSGQYGITARRLDADTAATLAGGAISTSAFTIREAVVNHTAATADLLIGGTSVASSGSFLTTGTTQATNSQAISVSMAAVPWGGDVAELLVWPRALAAYERASIRRYLTARYAL